MSVDAPSSTSRPRRGDRDPVLTIIAFFKFCKALVLIVIGLGALQLVRPEVREQARELFEALGQTIDVVPVLRLLRGIGALAPKSLRLVGAGAFLYAALFLTEGTGLWLQKRWAEYLTVVATASFIPFEIFELTRKLSFPRAGALVINALVLAYLIYRLKNPTSWQKRALHG